MRVLTREQVREVDRRAIEQFAVPGIVLMENAGRGVVELMLSLGVDGKTVICCGHGNNAGDGFVIARWLDLLGKPARVLRWAADEKLTGDAALNFEILQRSNLSGRRIESAGEELAVELEDADWVVDALLGTGAVGAPRPPLDRVIQQLNDCPARKLAVDLPSGLDADTGATPGAVFRADHTCTFVAAKPGLLSEGAAALVGRLHVLEIGAPRAALRAGFQSP